MGTDSLTQVNLKLHKLATHIVPLTTKLNKLSFPASPPSSSNQPLVIAKGDSAASQNYWREADKHCLSSLQPYTGTSVILPDGDTLTPHQQGIINLNT